MKGNVVIVVNISPENFGVAPSTPRQFCNEVRSREHIADALDAAFFMQKLAHTKCVWEKVSETKYTTEFKGKALVFEWDRPSLLVFFDGKKYSYSTARYIRSSEAISLWERISGSTLRR